MLTLGDRFEVGGGYDMEPKWLLGREEPFRGVVLRFLDNGISGREAEERLSAVVRFDEEIEFDGLRSRFGLLTLRYAKQRWEDGGTCHAYLVAQEPHERIAISEETSRWMESHATYKKADL
jgi:hypothetical protein